MPIDITIRRRTFYLGLAAAFLFGAGALRLGTPFYRQWQTAKFADAAEKIAEKPEWASSDGGAFKDVNSKGIFKGHFYVYPKDKSPLRNPGDANFLREIFDRYQARVQQYLPVESIPDRISVMDLKGSPDSHGTPERIEWYLDSQLVVIHFAVEWVASWESSPNGFVNTGREIRVSYYIRTR